LILRHGLPSSVNPSDHIPVGAIFQWTATSATDLASPRDPERQAGAGQGSNAREGGQRCEGRCPHQEAAELLEACPFASEEQRAEFLEITSRPFELVKGQRPSAAELEVLASLKQRRDALFGTTQAGNKHNIAIARFPCHAALHD
jgi:hypothetical protein